MGRVGGGIALIVIGAILTFALRADIPGLGEYALGLILMLGGVLLLVMHFLLADRWGRTRTVVEERDTVVDDTAIVEEPVDEPRVVRRRRRRLS